MLATKPGSVVRVVRAQGQAVWDAVTPGVHTLDTTPEVMSHDFLLVSCSDNVNQMGYKGAPGIPDPVIGETQVVVDTVTGQVLMEDYVAKGQTNTFAPAHATSSLGTPVTMPLSAASFR